jgi:hypothetical protein
MLPGKVWFRSKGASDSAGIALEASEGEVVANGDDEP